MGQHGDSIMDFPSICRLVLEHRRWIGGIIEKFRWWQQHIDGKDCRSIAPILTFIQAHFIRAAVVLKIGDIVFVFCLTTVFSNIDVCIKPFKAYVYQSNKINYIVWDVVNVWLCYHALIWIISHNQERHMPSMPMWDIIGKDS